MNEQHSTTAYDLEAHYAQLETTITAGNLPVELGRVRAAFELAERSHAGQKRKDGALYLPLHRCGDYHGGDGAG